MPWGHFLFTRSQQIAKDSRQRLQGLGALQRHCTSQHSSSFVTSLLQRACRCMFNAADLHVTSMFGGAGVAPCGCAGQFTCCRDCVLCVCSCLLDKQVLQLVTLLGCLDAVR